MPHAPENRAPASRHLPILFAGAAITALAGLADALYLTIQHLNGETVRCTVISGCSEVLGSRYAVVAGVPLALVGAIAYFSVFSLATLAAFHNRLAAKVFTLIVGLMFLTTIWLLYLQAFVIHHFCQFCLLSALVTLALTVIAIIASRFSSLRF